MTSNEKAADLFAASQRPQINPSNGISHMVAQPGAACNPQPDYVCNCGKPMSRCDYPKCNGYVDLTCNADGWHWRTWAGGGSLAKTSHVAYATQLEAARAGAIVAHCNGLPLKTDCSALRQDLLFAWQMEGIEAARAGHPIDLCWNKYQRQGYQSVMQPGVFGWPA